MIVEAPLSRASAIVLRPTAPVPCTSDAVAGAKRRALDDVDGRQQPAAAADIVVELTRVRQPRDSDAGLEVDALRPAAEQAFGGRVRDAVDATCGAPRRRAMDRAGAAPAAGAVHVEEHDAIALAKRLAVDAAERAANRLEDAGGDVAGNDRIRHAGQAAVPQVHVGAAHFRSRGPQQRGASAADPDAGTRGSRWAACGAGHDGGEDAVARGDQ